MLQPARLDLEVWRNAPFPADDFQIMQDGAPLVLTGLRVWSQVRLYEGAPGAPLIDAASDAVHGPTPWIEIVDAANGIFGFRELEASLEGLPAAPAGKPLTLAWDLRIGPTGLEQVYLYGQWTVHTGVTRT